MSQPPRRGLGRGLGSLIPSAAPEPTPYASAVAEGIPASSTTQAPAPFERTTQGFGTPTAAQSAPVATQTDLVPVEGAYFAELPLDKIVPNHVQPRTVFDETDMAELVHSVREIGVLQPIVVRPDGDKFELIMGERRWRASKAAGRDTIPAIVRQTEDVDMLRDALLENLHRSNLNPLEEAAAYQQLLDDFACTHEELAERIGRSRPTITNTLRLLKLSPAVQRRVAAGVLSAGHARALVSIQDEETQDRLASRVVAEGISVRGLEELVSLGDDGGPKLRATPGPKVNAPGLGDLSDRLADRLDTRVKVDLGRTKGKVTIEFATFGDLQRIVNLIDPRPAN
jgi:ParB family transcriptional regulator, chromosome partitioning protein